MCQFGLKMMRSAVLKRKFDCLDTNPSKAKSNNETYKRFTTFINKGVNLSVKDGVHLMVRGCVLPGAHFNSQILRAQKKANGQYEADMLPMPGFVLTPDMVTVADDLARRMCNPQMEAVDTESMEHAEKKTAIC
jgi:hypothetical protein